MCGAIRYEISEVPLRVYACHCTDCQRITGSAFSLGVVVSADAFRATGKDRALAPPIISASGRTKEARYLSGLRCGCSALPGPTHSRAPLNVKNPRDDYLDTHRSSGGGLKRESPGWATLRQLLGSLRVVRPAFNGLSLLHHTPLSRQSSAHEVSQSTGRRRTSADQNRRLSFS